MSKAQIFCYTYAGGSASFFDGIEKELPGFELVKPDYAGHGARRKEPFCRDFTELADDLFTRFRGDYAGGKYALFGYSMGAITAAEILKRILETPEIPAPAHVYLAAHEPRSKTELDGYAPEESDKLWLLGRLAAWTEYFFTYRPGRGMLCVYQRPLETGWEDAPQYRLGMPQISPDLNTFLALSCEAVARFGATLGMPESIQRLWLDRAERIVSEMVETLWDGERWRSLCVETGARSENDNLTFCLPALLGKRLPQDVLDKTIARLLRDGGFKTPYGYASEALDSPYLRHGFSAGSIITPTHFFVPMLLEENGYAAEAKEAALSYCRTLKRCGFFHICNALTGREDRSLTAFGEKQLFWSAWTSSCYFFLAGRYGG